MRVMVSLLVLALFIGCSNLKTRQSLNGQENGEQKVEEKGTAGAPAKADALPSKLLTSRDVSRGRKLPERYRRFEIAVGAQDSRAIMEEAEKFLTANENDLVILNGLGLFHYQRGRPEAARLFWAKALEAEPDHPTFLNNIAVLELQDDDRGVALDYLKKAYRKDSRHFEVLTNLGIIHLKGGQFKKALDFLEQAQRLRNTGETKKHLALAYHLNGEFKKAKALYEDILKEDMNDAGLMFNYASLLVEHLENNSEAMVWLNRIEFVGTDNQDLRRKADKLRSKAQ